MEQKRVQKYSPVFEQLIFNKGAEAILEKKRVFSKNCAGATGKPLTVK